MSESLTQPAINIVIGATIFLILVIALLLFIFTAGKKVEIFKEELKEADARKEEATIKAHIQGVEEERKRIGGDIHDDIGPMLAVAKMSLQDFTLCKDEASTQSHIQKVEQEIDEVAQKIRDLSKELVPEVLIEQGLEGAIRQVCRKINIRGKLFAQFEFKGKLPPMEIKDQLKILRITQELSNNAAKYAQAENLYIRISHQPKALTLEVEDDGKGIDLEPLNQGAQKGFGLKNIALRAKELGGKFEMYHAKPKGTKAVVTMFET